MLLRTSDWSWLALVPAFASLGLIPTMRRWASTQLDALEKIDPSQSTDCEDLKARMEVRISRILQASSGEPSSYPADPAARRYLPGIETAVFIHVIRITTANSPITPESQERARRMDIARQTARDRQLPWTVGAGAVTAVVYLLLALLQPTPAVFLLALLAAVAASTLAWTLRYYQVVPSIELQAWLQDRDKSYAQLLEIKVADLQGELSAKTKSVTRRTTFLTISLFGSGACIVLAYIFWPLAACVALYGSLDSAARSGLNEDHRRVMESTVDFTALQKYARESGRSLFYDEQGHLRGANLGQRLASYIAAQGLGDTVALFASPEGFTALYGLAVSAQTPGFGSQNSEATLAGLTAEEFSRLAYSLQWSSPTEATLDMPSTHLRLHFRFSAWRWRIHAVSFAR